MYQQYGVNFPVLLIHLYNLFNWHICDIMAANCVVQSSSNSCVTGMNLGTLYNTNISHIYLYNVSVPYWMIFLRTFINVYFDNIMIDGSRESNCGSGGCMYVETSLSALIHNQTHHSSYLYVWTLSNSNFTNMNTNEVNTSIIYFETSGGFDFLMDHVTITNVNRNVYSDDHDTSDNGLIVGDHVAT